MHIAMLEDALDISHTGKIFCQTSCDNPCTCDLPPSLLIASSMMHVSSDSLHFERPEIQALIVSLFGQGASASTCRELDRLGTVACFCGRHTRFLVKTSAMTLGRATESNQVKIYACKQLILFQLPYKLHHGLALADRGPSCSYSSPKVSMKMLGHSFPSSCSWVTRVAHQHDRTQNG